MAEPILDYDTDAISITSSVSSTKTETYNVNAILSETLTYDSDGERDKKFLIEWDGYPLYRCTWEPEENLEGTDLLVAWDLKRAQLGKAAFRKYMDKNEADFDKASEAAENAKELRHLKRIKKRAQIRKRNRPTVIIDDDGEDSEDDIPLAQLSRAGLPKMNPPPAIPTGSQEKRAIGRLFNDSQELPASDLFVKQPLIARKPFLGQSSSENEEEDEDDVSSNIESDDSFLEEIARKAPRKTKTKTNIREKRRRDAEPVLGNSVLSPKSSRSRAAGPSTKAITKKAGTHMTVRPTGKIQPPTTGKQAALKSTEFRPAPVGLMVARRKANVNVATAPAAKTAIRRSGEGGKTSTSSAIKIFHGPKTKQRKEWNTEDRQYTKMRYRGIAEKRGRVEATPELNELDFPAGRAPTSLSKLNPRAPDEDIYGRREGGNRRIQEIEADLPSGPGEADALDPLQDWQADKVPLMCYDWRSSNSCRNGPIKCKFMHRDKDENGRDYPYGDASGSIPPKFRKPQITCFYWLTKSYGCNKPPELCLYAHRNTGYSPKTGSHDGEIVKIDSTLEPFSERKQTRDRDLVAQQLPPNYTHDLPFQHTTPKFLGRDRDPPLTCHYWMTTPLGCKKSDFECDFAHYNTGWVPERGNHGAKIIKIDLNAIPASELKARRTLAPTTTLPPKTRMMTAAPMSWQEKRKIPSANITCWYWATPEETCRNTAETCKYQHYHTGIVADPPPMELTCRDWVEGRCFRQEGCMFQHRNTGIMSGGQSSGYITMSPQDFPSGASRFTDTKTAPTLQDRIVTSAILPTEVPSLVVRFADDKSTSTHQGLIVPSAIPPLGVHPSRAGNINAYSAQTRLGSNITDDVEMDDVNPLSPADDLPPSRPLTAADEQPHKFLPPTTMTPALSSSLQLRQKVEAALKVQFAELFGWSSDGDTNTEVDRRAILLHHSQEHSEELEILLRWLSMHHVEVSSAWDDGSWEYFKQQTLNGGSGVIIAHPDFEYFSELPDFSKVLRNRVRLWSLGMQEGIEYDSGVLNSPPQLRHDCIEIFPAGGFIYITDEVFETKPQLALSIIKLFFAKIERLRSLDGAASLWHEVDDALVLWRLCVRPELMEHLMERCEQRAKDLDAGDPDMVALAQLYTLFSNTNYIEQDTPMEPLNNIPDKYPVLSERRIIAEEQPVDYFNTLAQSQEKANLHMIRYFAGLQIDMRRDYRHFFVVHTEPSAPCAKEWMSEIQTIADVITPEQCIVELEKDGSVSMFDFCERYMQKKDVKLASPVAPVVDSQCSIEEGEIRSQS